MSSIFIFETSSECVNVDGLAEAIEARHSFPKFPLFINDNQDGHRELDEAIWRGKYYELVAYI